MTPTSDTEATPDRPDTVEGVPRVSILTPTIEGREELLAEAAASVKAQTEEVAHLIYLDTERVGPAVARNRLLERVQSEWVGFLDDDDLLDATHVEALMALLDVGLGDAPAPDLAWSRCRTQFADGVQHVHVLQPMRGSGDLDGMFRRGRNWIPVTVIARTESVRRAGGFDASDRYEDYELWRRMHQLGMSFAHLPVATWTYRFLGNNRTHQ